MNKSDRKLLEQALNSMNAMLTHMGMDEDDWNKTTFDQMRKTISDIELNFVSPDRALSPTSGMNIAQRILHVGGRNNEAGYIEFGSIQAVEALVFQVLRDLPSTSKEIK